MPLSPRPAAWLIAGLLPLAACQAAPPLPAQDSAGLLRQLDEAIGEAPCTADRQCRTVAVGHKACGGPEAWRAYAPGGGREPQILALAKAQAEARRREQAASGMVSDCSVVSDPGAVCGPAGRCVPGEGRGASAR